MKNKTLELLLGADKSKFQRIKKEVEVKRLSELVGEQVVFTCKALSANEYSYIQETVVDSKGNISPKDYEMSIVLTSIDEFKNSELMSSYGAATPKELVNKLLLPGEISKISEYVLSISGFKGNPIEEVIGEVKN